MATQTPPSREPPSGAGKPGDGETTQAQEVELLKVV